MNGYWQRLYQQSGNWVQIVFLLVNLPADFHVHPAAKKVKVKVQFSTKGTTSAHCVVDSPHCSDLARPFEVLISAYSAKGQRVTSWGKTAPSLYRYVNGIANWMACGGASKNCLP